MFSSDDEVDEVRPVLSCHNMLCNGQIRGEGRMGSSGSRAGMHTPWIDGVGVVAHPVHHHFHLQCIITHVCSGISKNKTNNDIVPPHHTVGQLS